MDDSQSSQLFSETSCTSDSTTNLDIIISLIEDANADIHRLCGYIEDAVCILQKLTKFVKNMIESVAITCSTAKNFSIFLGDIILSVFNHCKDSECIYRNSLHMVEKQLKDLFRNCHELQLTYLMALEKHLLFDLTVKEDQDILIKTLEINLEIGYVVQSMDVKTMAEQWKATMMICEKYSSFLLEKNIFNRSSKLLAAITKNNIKIALESNEEDKVALRSLKVANFSLKILQRICNIFKCSINNDYEHLVNLLLHINLCTSSYYEVTAKISLEFSSLMNTYLSMPVEALIGSLVNDENFLKIVLLKDTNELKDNKLLEYILFLTLIIKAFPEKSVTSDAKNTVICTIFSLLPYCHKWFNMGLKLKYLLKDGTIQYHGLYEHLLLHTLAFTATFDLEQYKCLENYMYEALLGTEYYSALFASNLWILLCRFNNTKLQLDTLVALLNVYQRLETHPSFDISPQKIHLSYTIENLFETLDDKSQVFTQFPVNDARNSGIWYLLKIRNLENYSRKLTYTNISENLFASFDQDLDDNEILFGNLIKHIKLASTCSFVKADPKMEELLLKAWLKACPVCEIVLQRDLSVDCLWYFRYIEVLTSLTCCYIEKFEHRTNVIKILTVMSNILLIKNTETVHLLFKVFCRLSSFVIADNDVNNLLLFANTIKTLFGVNNDFQPYLFSVIVISDDISKLIAPVLKDPSLKHQRDNYIDFKNKQNDIKEWQKQLEIASEYKYEHRCMEINRDIKHINKSNSMDSNHSEDVKETQKNKNDFDLGDVDSLFGESDGEEPASKKAKLDLNVERLIVRLENDVENLSRVKENILSDVSKERIRKACDKLKNIIS